MKIDYKIVYCNCALRKKLSIYMKEDRLPHYLLDNCISFTNFLITFRNFRYAK